MRIKIRKIYKPYVYFFILWILVFPFFKKFQLFKEIYFLESVEEILLIPLVFLSFQGFKFFLKFKPYSYIFIVSYLFYLIIGVVSGLLNPLPFKNIFFQLVLELKFPYILFLFFGIFINGIIKTKFIIKLFKILIVISIPLIIFQFLFPDFHNALFNGASSEGVLNAGSLVLPRGIGFFWHPSELAYFSAVAFGFFYIKGLFGGGRESFTWIIISFMVLISSFERQEIIAILFLSIVFWFFLYKSKQSGIKLLYIHFFILLFLITIVMGYIFLTEPILFSLEQEGLFDVENTRAARMVFYYVGILTANQYFPFGGGIGSFGGKAAVVFDSFLYQQFDFDRFWWYKERTYMTDTYWPHIIAESGWFGFFSLLLSFLALYFLFFNVAKKSSLKENKIMMYTSSFCLLVMINISLTSPVPNSIFCLLLTWIFFPLVKIDHELYWMPK